MAVHVYAPPATRAEALTDYNCLGRCCDGRRCGSYHAVAHFIPWHGWTVTCCACGRQHEDGYWLGRVADGRLAAIRSEHAAIREAP